MTIPDGFLEELRGRLRLVEVVGRKVRLVRRGREHLGLCPFHNEKTPSFTVNEAKGFYHCFGCGAHGSVFDFVMHTENLGFTDAVARLAEEVGLAVPVPSPEAQALHQRRQTLFDALETAAAYFEKMLHMPEGRVAHDYLAGRGLKPETIARFRLGFAPDARFALKAALARAGIGEDLLIESGLVIVPGDGGGGSYDRFRGRVMFPITDHRGRVVGFGGRVLGAGEPKYLNSPETSLFHKGRLLYGLSQALAAIGAAGTVIVVEGYIDVIGLAQAGHRHTVAPLGTALTADQVQALWRLAAEPILWFDPDSAGRRAAVRAAELALPLVRPGFGLRFAFSQLDTKDDPADLARRYAPQFVHRTLEDAIALSDLVFRIARSGARLATAEDRARIEARLDEQVARIADAKMQRHYRGLFRDRLFRELRANQSAQTRGGTGGAAGHVPAPLPAATPAARLNAERSLVGLVLCHPWLFDGIEERLGSMRCAEAGLDALRQGLVAALSGRDRPPAAAALRAELAAAGFTDALISVLDDPVQRLAGRRAAAAPEADVGARCAELLAEIDRARLRDELARAAPAPATADEWALRRSMIAAALDAGDD